MTERNIRDNNKPSTDATLGAFVILVHLGLLITGMIAWLSGDLADDYKKLAHSGFTLHSWLGMGAAFFIFLRLVWGVLGPQNVRFTQWVPFTKERLARAGEDIRGLLRFHLPERPTHEGLSGLVQMFGLLVFLFMALSGGFLFFSLEPGQKAGGLAHAVKELHEAGVLLIPLFLFMHAGAVTLHALSGRHLWRRMLFLNAVREVTPRSDAQAGSD
ncbi:MAG: cytochrome b/b6 domain-containing protein [Nitrospirota bacterium]|nr:cytochrome b/b6 domain-containing protein [Nitrospirota bacterium]